MNLPFNEALARADAPAWWTPHRRRALDRFLRDDFPSSRQEDWKYTPLAHLQRLNLHAPAGSGEVAVWPLPPYPGEVLAFRNDGELGVGAWRHEMDEVVSSLQRAADNFSVRRHFGSLAGDSALVNLNDALWRDGAHVLVPAGRRLARPIFLAHYADEAEAMLYPRSLIVLESGAEAVLVEHYYGSIEAPYWRNAVTEIVLAPGAQLTHIRVVEEGVGATHTGVTAVRADRDALYRVLHVGLGGALARHDLKVELAGPGAEVRSDACHLAGSGCEASTSVRDLHLSIDHQAPHTRSRVHYRGLIDGRGRGVCDGRILVRPEAVGTDAHMLCRSLLLSPHAEADMKPQLEIHADEVKCGHGASAGHLDDAALFYLQSRGIDPGSARRLLMEAFTVESLGLLDETGLKDWLMPALLARLPATQEELA